MVLVAEGRAFRQSHRVWLLAGLVACLKARRGCADAGHCNPHRGLPGDEGNEDAPRHLTLLQTRAAEAGAAPRKQQPLNSSTSAATVSGKADGSLAGAEDLLALFAEADGDSDGLLSAAEARDFLNLAEDGRLRALQARLEGSEGSPSSPEATWDRCQHAFQFAFDCTFISPLEGGAMCPCGKDDCSPWFGWCMGIYPDGPTPAPGIGEPWWLPFALTSTNATRSAANLRDGQASAFGQRFQAADRDGDLGLSQREARRLAESVLGDLEAKRTFRRSGAPSARAGQERPPVRPGGPWGSCQKAFQVAFDCTFLPAVEGGARCGCAHWDCHYFFRWCMGLDENPTPSPEVVPLEYIEARQEIGY
mmetsp:Transcript_19501/g.56619  ORF Transcript_19501/g.56619 Transcript_19501/m.56619 type:complete len:363 (-) Transcript_19501:174-1262(-)